MFRCMCTDCTGYGPKPQGTRWIHLPSATTSALRHKTPRGQMWVYVLVDPRDNAIRYIGITNRPGQRLRQHISARHTRATSGAWVTELVDQHNVKPYMVLLDLVPKHKAYQFESALIRDLLALGTPLTNRTRKAAD